MKVNKERMKNQIDEIVNYGAAHCEECDLTVTKVMQVIEPLILVVEAISQMQPEWVSVSEKENRLKEGDKVWIEMDYTEWGRNEKRVTIADVWFAKEPRGYGGPNALTGSGMLIGIYFSLPAIVNPACVKRFCLIPQPPTK